MFFPFISKRSTVAASKRQDIERRAKRAVGSDGSESAGEEDEGPGGGIPWRIGEGTAQVEFMSGTYTISTDSEGVAQPRVIQDGDFKGRVEGGGLRSDVLGTRIYGSGYPGIPESQRGVSGRHFPYFFWPIVWDHTPGTPSYLYTDEYGPYYSTSRPGGRQKMCIFVDDRYPPEALANRTANPIYDVMRFIADNATATLAIYDIEACIGPWKFVNCTDYAPGINEASPQPWEVVSYFRASSAVLTMDGYNNSRVFNTSESAKDTGFPLGGTWEFCPEYISKKIPLVVDPDAVPAEGGAAPVVFSYPTLVLVLYITTMLSAML